MRIGLIARADNTGLGVQTQDFARHMNPSKILIVDLEHLNGLKTYPERYPGAAVLKYTPYPEVNKSHPASVAAINSFLDGLDLVFSCETPYDYHLFTEARHRGIRTILQYNFELLDHLQNPHAPQPDLFMAPSYWRYADVEYNNKVFVPVPVDTERFTYKHRKVANTFLHLAGNNTAEDRNGTASLLASWNGVKPETSLLVRSPRPIIHHASNILIDNTLIHDNIDLYAIGDVLVMPRKFGGLCLPLNEALAVGMPVIMTDVCPQSDFLSPSALVSAPLNKKIMVKTFIDIHEVNQIELAAKINELVDNPNMVSFLSEQSGELAQLISWKRLAPVYQQVFEAVMDGVTPSNPFCWPDSKSYN